MRACEKCAFYRADEDHSQMGECRRYAPRPILYDCSRDTSGPHDGIDVAWPKVLDEDFCGDWVAK